MNERLRGISRNCKLPLGALAYLLVAVGTAHSASLAPPSVAGQLVFANPFEGSNIDALGTFSLSRSTGSLKFTGSGTPAPSLLAEATLAPFFFGRASGSLTYQLEILGAPGDVSVSVTASGSVVGDSEDLSVDLFSGFAMKSVWSLEAPALGPLVLEDGIATPALTGSFSQTWSHTHHLTLGTNRVYKVTMIADAGVRAGSAAAFVDPVFSFGPGVDTSLYSFRFSEGIGNALPVPEPMSFALFGAGLLIVAFAKRAQTMRSMPVVGRV